MFFFVSFRHSFVSSLWVVAFWGTYRNFFSGKGNKFNQICCLKLPLNEVHLFVWEVLRFRGGKVMKLGEKKRGENKECYNHCCGGLFWTIFLIITSSESSRGKHERAALVESGPALWSKLPRLFSHEISSDTTKTNQHASNSKPCNIERFQLLFLCSLTAHLKPFQICF